VDYDSTMRVLEAFEREGVRYAVVSPRTLYRMKRDTGRLRDRADAELLRRRFGFEESG
jgi:hypothetical protein